MKILYIDYHISHTRPVFKMKFYIIVIQYIFVVKDIQAFKN